MMRHTTTAFLLVLAAACASGPRPADTESLAAALRQRVDAFRGKVGLYVRHLGTGAEVAIHADDVMPTASIVKVPILCGLLDRVERGEVDYHATLTYTKDRLYAGEDLLGAFADGEKVALAKVAMLSITTSDNTAALWCQELAGTGTTINAWLASNGFEHTRVNSRTEGRADAQKRHGWGQTTPREICELFLRIHEGRVVSPAASEELMRCLSRIYWDAEALSAIPPEVHVLSKQGAVSRSRSEVALVFAPHGAYVFAVITNEQEDTSWEHDNEGFVLLRDVSAMLWRHFEPERPYAPPPGSENYR